MHLISQSPHFKLTPESDDFIKDKVSQVSHLYERIENSVMFLKMKK